MAMAFRILLTMLIVSSFGRAALGGGGHDHGGGAAAVNVSPRVEARIGDQQLVLLYANRKEFQDATYRFFGGEQAVKLANPRVAVFLENFADATPTTGAKLEAVINFLPQELSEAAPGVYLSGPVTLGGGRNEIELTYTIGKESGTRRMMLLVPGGATSGTGALAIDAPVQSIPSWLFALAALFVYATVFGVFLRRRRHGAIG
jgi:hypothetical protein